VDSNQLSTRRFVAGEAPLDQPPFFTVHAALRRSFFRETNETATGFSRRQVKPIGPGLVSCGVWDGVAVWREGRMEDIIGASIPLVAIVMGIGVAFWRMYLDHQRRKLQYEERRLMIERGMTPPPLPPEVPRRSLEGSLRNGIIFVSLGLGFAVAYVLRQGPDLFSRPTGASNGFAIVAPILIMLGVGYLVYYTIARKQTRSVPPVA